MGVSVCHVCEYVCVNERVLGSELVSVYLCD